MSKNKEVVAGLGEIGKPIFNIISKSTTVVGFDTNKKIMDNSKLKKYESYPTNFLHICIPYNKLFIKNVLKLYKKFFPKGIAIHSTISPGTTIQLQKNLSIPVIYSATRGIHKRMLSDLKRYTKFLLLNKVLQTEVGQLQLILNL